MDPPISKILTAKQISHIAGPETEAGASRDSPEQDSSNEAEVRLVVRFTVEEHVIFKGKVERIHQLDSEELSRIVSKVAWKGTSPTSPLSSTKTDNADEPDKSSSNEPDRHDSSTQTDPNHFEQTKTKDELEPPHENSCERHTNPLDGSFAVQEGNSSSTEKPSLPTDTDTTTGSVIVADYLAHDAVKQSSLAQAHGPQKLLSPPPIPASPIIITDSNHPLASDRQKFDVKPVYADDFCDHVDKQSITDAINDCVDSVEREIGINSTPNTSCSPTSPKADTVTEEPRVNRTSPAIHHKGDVVTTITPQIDPNPLVGPLKQEAREASCSEKAIKPQLTSGKKVSAVGRPPNVPTDNQGTERTPTSTTISSGKRLRRAGSKDQKGNSKGATKLPAVASNRIKQVSQRTPIETSSNGPQARRNKIFAKWSDNHFYPGTILRAARDRKFVIGFLDGATKSVPETDLIPLCNIEGRQVRVSISKNYCVNAIVHDQRSPVDDQPMFDVEYQQDGIVRRSVPFKDIFLTGEQGMPLINQPDRNPGVSKNPGVSNFADVDLDNIIYEKRSRRLQEMEDFEFTENLASAAKKRRGPNSTRQVTQRNKVSATLSDSSSSPAPTMMKSSRSDASNQDVGGEESPDTLKTEPICPNSNLSSENSNSTNSSNALANVEQGQEFYFTDSSPHRTKTSLLL